jgi:hypothetical protein
MKKIWVRLGATVTLTDEENSQLNANTFESILVTALKDGRAILDGETYLVSEEEWECQLNSLSLKVVTQPRMAYFIQQNIKDKYDKYIPCIAVENEPGYNLTDWAWGADLDKAEAIADEKNEALGLTKDEAMKIVLSTMRSKR